MKYQQLLMRRPPLSHEYLWSPGVREIARLGLLGVMVILVAGDILEHTFLRISAGRVKDFHTQAHMWICVAALFVFLFLCSPRNLILFNPESVDAIGLLIMKHVIVM
ncbi:unnamed protein product [Amoebophrya sp. A120]|nr:unnamed protein product [Amoebophrya sp. A120]|eukprot:GSA120T00010932001.1